jgi:hypothetical protein
MAFFAYGAELETNGKMDTRECGRSPAKEETGGPHPQSSTPEGRRAASIT